MATAKHTDTSEQSSAKHTNNTYRFKLNESTIEIIQRFSIIHKTDTREDFKEAWKQFLIDNDEILKQEELALNQKGFRGNFYDKIYKSARYYYRTKTDTKKNENFQQRRKYVGLNKTLLRMMDDFITENKTINIEKNEAIFKPSDGYCSFYQKFNSIIDKEIQELIKQSLTHEDSVIKLKKTFKNRYFQLIKK